ncbi:class F sortase [Geodermatophilus sp. DSM 44513]|uniref:class F sortase n=1 Tax=Geodermatophilus sp. DSM 44513 TaxID=1528104 RepID=UPI001284DC6E|nr:class F sortase [Geodermatophilus sp. DSM 44513]WNV76869.1 class F sortase [Geodermatophilus sp. DSM 44513]
MAGTTPHTPSPHDPDHGDRTAAPPDLVDDLDDMTDDDRDDDTVDDDRDRPRRRLPSWLLPAVAALAVGLLIGSFLFGGSGAPTAGPAAVPTDGSGRPVPHLVTSLTRSEPVQIDIPAIGVSSSLVDLGLNPDGTLEVPVTYAKAGWFTGGNHPGDPQGPPALIAGHVDDHTGPAVFFRLDELGSGDEVHVTRADNTVAVFTVTQSRQYPKNAFPAQEVYAPVGSSEVVLITCTGAFDESARSYEDNLVVRATLDMERSLQASDERLASGQPAPAGDLPNV